MNIVSALLKFMELSRVLNIITINVPTKYKEDTKTKATTFKFMLYQNLPINISYQWN